LSCHLELGRDLAVALDLAASHFHDPEPAPIAQLDRRRCSRHRRDDRDARALVSNTDCLDRGRLGEDDWDGWTTLTARLAGPSSSSATTCSSPSRAAPAGHERRAANAILIK